MSAGTPEPGAPSPRVGGHPVPHRPSVDPAAPPDWDLMLALMGAGYADDGVSTALDWVAAAAAAGGRVQVWACGYATLLTQRALGRTKPRNAMDWDAEHLTTATWATDLLARHPGSVRWLACRFCSDERGAVDHVPAVRVRPAMSFGRHVAESAKTVFVGVI
ncbi:MAG: hypothetical protein ACFCVG_07845 [Kineosporiaceae bacterium]